MSKKMLEMAIGLLNEAKSQINKSEIRAIDAIDRAIRIIEKNLTLTSNNRNFALFLLVLLDDIVKNIPSLLALIHSISSS